MANRNRFFSLTLTVLALALAVGCEQHGHGNVAEHHAGSDAEPAAHGEAADTAHDAAMEASHTHDVRCGCALSEVGHCGNYIEVEGQFVELVLPEEKDLGDTPFCGKEELVAQAEGELVDGKFVATTFEYVE
jgi:hypothetical protein